jgi:hypothetical protein
MAKIIHYCWFGNNPMPKLAKQCIKSWQKYLPDYEIKRWDESNFDPNITPFSKKAYEQKKWAFVSDVARIYALKKYGGIYFDTDMMLTKNIDFLLKDDFFVGWESKDHVAVGVLGVKNPENKIINDLYDVYKNISFDENNLYAFSIPKVLTKLLKTKYGLGSNHMQNQKLKENICVYAREYFYPLSYDHRDNLFTENTCMIHYYDASWISKPQRRIIRLYRMLGKEKGDKFVQGLRKMRKGIKLVAKILLFPLLKIRAKVREEKRLSKMSVEIGEALKGFKEGGYIVIYNPDWLGTTYATKELFEHTLPIGEFNSEKYSRQYAEQICSKKPKLVVFSAFAEGWEKIARYVKEIDEKIVIKTIWHGSNAMHVEEYDWFRFKEIFNLYNDKVISSLGFVKKSMADFYKLKGYNTEFVMNTVAVEKDKYVEEKNEKKSKNLKIGLYASGDRWVKNFYNQICATSLVPNVSVDCIPIGEKVYELADLLQLHVSGSLKPLPREELLSRIAKNDINVYVTFVECAPMLPLESFELGVPCITGNNHHYWENHELRKYIVVEEADNSMKIYEKIMFCLENKEKVLKMYSEWKKEYDKEVKKNIANFLTK